VTRFARFLAAALLCLVAVQASADCVRDRVSLRGDWGQAQFRVEVADTPNARSTGLMNREHLDRNAGMLFVYEVPQRVSFWMRNTLIPLDMIFIGPDGIVRRVYENAVPLDETPIPGGPGILAVLEINGGLAGSYGIEPGTEVRHEAFSQGAVWPCD